MGEPARYGLIELLRGRQGEYLSGEAIGKALGVSRMAVSKAAQSLQGEGYPIESAHRSGYRLTANPDVLSEYEIRRGLKTKWLGKTLEVYPSLSSTSLLAKERADSPDSHGLVIAAGEQSMGQGRRHTSFYSPAQTGVYVSMVAYGDYTMRQTALLREKAERTVARVLQQLLRQDMKSPPLVCDGGNGSLIIAGKKVCGMMTEGVVEFGSDLVKSLVLGVGVHVNEETFPEGLAATSLLIQAGCRRSRASLIACLLNALEPVLEQAG